MNTSPFYLAADLTLAESNGADLPRRFIGLAYSGGLIPGHNAVIDLASTAIEPSMPLLFQHNHEQVIGAITTAANDAVNLTVSGDLFSDIDDTARDLAMKSQRGARYQMSVGIFDMSFDSIPPGRSVVVNGQPFAGPLDVLRNGTVREVSVVALGADANTAARFFSAAHAAPTPEGVPEMAETATLDALQSRVRELEAENQALKDAAQAAELAARKSRVAAFAAKTGKTYSADETAALESMTDAQFAVLDGLAAQPAAARSAASSPVTCPAVAASWPTKSWACAPSDQKARPKPSRPVVTKSSPPCAPTSKPPSSGTAWARSRARSLMPTPPA